MCCYFGLLASAYLFSACVSFDLNGPKTTEERASRCIQTSEQPINNWTWSRHLDLAFPDANSGLLYLHLKDISNISLDHMTLSNLRKHPFNSVHVTQSSPTTTNQANGPSVWITLASCPPPSPPSEKWIPSPVNVLQVNGGLVIFASITTVSDTLTFVFWLEQAWATASLTVKKPLPDVSC